jgi:non-specific serine/threonine protein kinase
VLLETVREFGFERLVTEGEEAAAKEAQAQWCIDLADSAVPYWFSPDQPWISDRIEQEHDHIRAALTWLSSTNRTNAAARLAGRLWQFWFVRGHWPEGRVWMERALDWSAGTTTIDRLRHLTGATCFALMQGDTARALELEAEQVALYASLGDDAGMESPLVGLAILAGSQGDFDRCDRLFAEEIDALRRVRDSVPNAAPRESIMLTNRAFNALAQGDDARADALATQALELQKKLGFDWGVADSLVVLGDLAKRRDDVTTAARLYKESLALAWKARDQIQIAEVFGRLAGVACDYRQFELTGRLLGAAEHLIQLLGQTPGEDSHVRLATTVAAAQSQIGEAAFELAMAAGREADLASIVAEALTIGPSSHARQTREELVAGELTSREHDVLALVAKGHTDREIAELLYLSRRTVNYHVANILAKLDVSSRRAAVAMATDRGWLPTR